MSHITHQLRAREHARVKEQGEGEREGEGECECVHACVSVEGEKHSKLEHSFVRPNVRVCVEGSEVWVDT